MQRYRNKRRQRKQFKNFSGDSDGFNISECPREILDMQDFLIQMCYEEDTKSANYSLNNGKGGLNSNRDKKLRTDIWVDSNMHLRCVTPIE